VPPSTEGRTAACERGIRQDALVAKVLDASVTPFYAQVLLTTSPDAEHPQWVSGDELAVTSGWAIAISTVPDLDPNPRVVSVEVWVDEMPALDGWTEVVRTPLLVSSWGVAVGDVVSSESHRAAIAPGEYEAAVYGKPVPRPSELCVLLTH
jgi:hypothetical protein